MTLIKKLRKQCLYEGCNCKATHFFKKGWRRGLCDEHYETFQCTMGKFKGYIDKLSSLAVQKEIPLVGDSEDLTQEQLQKIADELEQSRKDYKNI